MNNVSNQFEKGKSRRTDKPISFDTCFCLINLHCKSIDWLLHGRPGLFLVNNFLFSGSIERDQ